MPETLKKIGYVIRIDMWLPGGGIYYLNRFIEPHGMDKLGCAVTNLFALYEEKDEDDKCFFTRLQDAERALKRYNSIPIMRENKAEIEQVMWRDKDGTIIAESLAD